MKPDLFQAPDYYLLDDLLTEEHKLVRDSARAWVKREVSPIIEDYAQRAEFPKQIIKGLGEIGGFGPYIPEEYGGAGLDQISYGLIMQEIERGDSGVRSTASVQSSLVMYPIQPTAIPVFPSFWKDPVEMLQFNKSGLRSPIFIALL